MRSIFYWLIGGALFFLLISALPWFIQQTWAPTVSQSTPGVETIEVPSTEAEVFAQDLAIPWALAWLPDGTLLVTERPGRILAYIPGARERREITLPDTVAHVGESGLLGLAVHPDFTHNNLIYLYRTFRLNDDRLINRVERYVLVDFALTEQTIIVNNISGAQFHSGGRLAFGPDRNLYITTGDAGNADRAQDLSSLAGKILRVHDDGSIPSDNPFGTAVYTYGHRNVQGITWNGEGQAWATEHGRSGVQSGLDELNLIRAGNNYGWPVIEGDETQAGMLSAVIQSGPNDTWAPAGAAFVSQPGQRTRGSIFFGGLRGQSLYEAAISGQKVVELRQHFRTQFGRIRAVDLGPDGLLYLTTSNTDGRGTAGPGDDKIIRINPRFLMR